MCGIAGVVGPRAGDLVELVGRMQAAIRHRGPDEGGLLDLPSAVLASRRLSILDLEGGRQPISNEDGTIHVVFNGEIYDHELHHRRLQEKGHRFRTRSDTEILVHAYEEQGDHFLDGLNGMFGLAIYDQPRDRLVLARDRLGKKPLYYTLRDRHLYFASELKAILIDPAQPRQVDLEGLSHYLTLETVPAPWTILEGVHKLAPGTMLIFEAGRLEVRRYWDARFIGPGVPATEAAAREELDQLLDRAVRRRLVADVPVGVFLSGGIDSSTVAWYASRASSRIQTYSIGFEEASFDESSHARAVAKALGTEHHEERLSAAKALELLPAVTANLDEPFADASILPTFLLSRYTRQHVKVALGGDGGDEILLGYPTYLAHQLYRYYEWIPASLRRGLIPGLVDGLLPVSFENISLDFKIRRFVAGGDLSQLQRDLVWLGSFSTEAKQRLLSSEVRAALGPRAGLDFAERMVGALPVKDPLERVLYLDMKIYMAEDILTKVDRASMANSLEVRAPLLDYELVEFLLKLPVAWRFDGRKGKKILKDLMRPRLPEGIVDRPKKGFGMPVAHWITGPLKEMMIDLLAPARLKQQGFFDPTEVQRLIKEHLRGERDHRKPLWTLLMFQSWLKEYGA